MVRIPAGVTAPLLFFMLALASLGARAAPQSLECTLTDTDAQTAAEHRSIELIFDEEAATLKFREGGRTRNLGDVSISTTSISGGEPGMTVGISRSSWRVVVQTYQKNSVRTEYGVCALSAR
jgi:hypothetical protein